MSANADMLLQFMDALDVEQVDLVGNDSGGGIARRIRVFRLPDQGRVRHLKLSRRIALRDDADNALFVCATTEDGHLAWSSPIYVFR